MKLKVRNLKINTKKPVVFLEAETAKELGVSLGQRILLERFVKVGGVVDITHGILEKNEIGLSKELSKILDVTSRSKIKVTPLPPGKSDEFIKKKFMGEKLTGHEIEQIVKDITTNNLTEAEITYFISGQKFNGMSHEEVYHLTKAMVESGKRIEFNTSKISDKHCVGGVAGNRTTPIIVPICASLGLTIPKTSSRAITSAAGTADVLETIANVNLELGDLRKIIKKENACMIWNSNIKLSPSDDEIIQIERILNLDVSSQLVASVLSKKISMGSKNIIIDIPYGRNSKVKNLNDAKYLRELFLYVSKKFNLNVKVLLTDGSLPIGNGVGPILEMLDVLKVLRNEKDAPKDLRKKSIFLSRELLKLNNIRNPSRKINKSLKSGEAYEKFRRIINLQNKNKDFDKIIEKLKPGKYKKNIQGWKGGKIIEINNKKINKLCRILGSPEDSAAGVYINKKTGSLKQGEDVITLYSNNQEKLANGINFFWQDKVFTFK